MSSSCGTNTASSTDSICSYHYFFESISVSSLEQSSLTFNESFSTDLLSTESLADISWMRNRTSTDHSVSLLTCVDALSLEDEEDSAWNTTSFAFPSSVELLASTIEVFEDDDDDTESFSSRRDFTASSLTGASKSSRPSFNEKMAWREFMIDGMLERETDDGNPAGHLGASCSSLSLTALPPLDSITFDYNASSQSTLLTSAASSVETRLRSEKPMSDDSEGADKPALSATNFEIVPDNARLNASLSFVMATATKKGPRRSISTTTSHAKRTQTHVKRSKSLTEPVNHKSRSSKSSTGVKTTRGKVKPINSTASFDWEAYRRER